MSNSDSVPVGNSLEVAKKASLRIVWMHLIKRLIMLIFLSIIIIATLHLAVGKDCIPLSMILGKMLKPRF